jgi:NadR type nicotinamide-nucleotide adenylyltransferase
MDGICFVEEDDTLKSCCMKKIAIIGPESTGKSTLCEQLAVHYKTVWCPEYAREYLLTNGKVYKFEDLAVIAKGQLALEDGLCAKANNEIYFIDTNMYVMQVWCEFVFQKCHQFILDKIVERKYDLYLLCNIDLPWAYDELREYPDEKPRKELYRMYKELMIDQKTPWVEVSGSYEERFDAAVDAVQKFCR